MLSMTPSAAIDAANPFRAALVGAPTILVVEDDASIRRFICTVLKFATQALVLEAGDPTAALSAARDSGRPLDLLISDYDLSAAKTGIDLGRELVALNPATKVLLMSASDVPLDAIPRAWRFLAKPFPVSVLLASVQELCGVLNSSRSGENRSAA